MAIISGSPLGDVLIGTAFSDSITALDGDDTVKAGGRSDEVFGGLGNDRLMGGWGDDVLYGGAGSDTLSGGPGVDALRGGSGADVFRFRDDTGFDLVWDWSERDKIAIDAPGIDRFNDLSVSNLDGDPLWVLIDWGDAGVIIRGDFALSSFTSEDFLF